MELILVERLLPNKKGSLNSPLWLVFIGQKIPPLEIIWKKW